MRLTADSVEALMKRHGCVPVSTTPYDALLFPGFGPVTPVLNEILSKLAREYELVEVYVRPKGNETLFEPLEARHFPMEGEVAVIVRVIHPTDPPRIVGLMMAKDEADAIPEVCENLKRSLDKLYYFAQDADTAKALEEWSPWAIPIALHPEGKPLTDGYRQILLEAARLDAIHDNDRRPMWTLSVQGDEIFADDLKHHVLLAHQERATVLTCQVATFMLHDDQRDNWDWTLPLNKRLTHYIWDFGEHVGQRDFPWIYYKPDEHMRAHPHGIYPGVWAKSRPVRKHYPFRSPEQARKRIEDRLKSGWQPHYKNYQQIFFKDGDQPAGRELKRYHGWFPETEREPGIW